MKKSTWTPPSLESQTRERMTALVNDSKGILAGRVLSEVTNTSALIQGMSIAAGTYFTNDDPATTAAALRFEQIEITLDTCEKESRMAARRQAKAELIQWITAYCDSMTPDQWETNPNLERTLRTLFCVRYWERFLELAGGSEVAE